MKSANTPMDAAFCRSNIRARRFYGGTSACRSALPAGKPRAAPPDVAGRWAGRRAQSAGEQNQHSVAGVFTAGVFYVRIAANAVKAYTTDRRMRLNQGPNMAPGSSFCFRECALYRSSDTDSVLRVDLRTGRRGRRRANAINRRQ